ncbi:MAG: hypothetical protein SVX28_11685 [Pseudomonadota bacterium]|nr:hypothetical protein [Pseudomonadota bacterium]
MDNSAAKTILSLDERRATAEQGRQQALLELAELRHELTLLRHMRAEIVQCLTDRRAPLNRQPGNDRNCRHTLSKIARIVRNGRTSSTRHD